MKETRIIKNNDKLSEEQMVQVLDTLYNKALEGIPKVSKSVDELAESYLQKYESAEEAAQRLIKYQIVKCGTSGFLSGMGGLITLPISIPANVSSVLYIQLRMIASIAKIGGFDIRSDQVQTLVYVCLTGTAIADIFKQTGIKIGQKITESAIKSVPGKVLTSINQKVGFRLITKFGETGVINLVKVIPVAGGLVGGTMDIASTKVIAANAYSLFIKKSVPKDKERKQIMELFKDKVQVAGNHIGNGIDMVADKVKIAKHPNIKKPQIGKKKKSFREKDKIAISIPDEIRKYKELMDDGIITEEEYLLKKEQLLNL